MKTSESSQIKVGMRRHAIPKFNRKEDFTILCPAVAENSGVIEALYALYYLPQNYKLLISTVDTKNQALYGRISEIVRKDSLMDRVTFKGETGLSGATPPFLEANVVVYGSSDPVYIKGSPQSIVVFDIASKLRNSAGSHNFAVATSTPEALASAILKVARNQR